VTVTAKWHFIPSNAISREHDCDRPTDACNIGRNSQHSLPPKID